MARIAFAFTCDRSTSENERFSGGPAADMVAGSGYAAAKTAFEAALAVLVADGASPTQAHVTTANSTYTTLAATLAAPPSKTDLAVSIDLANVPNQTAAKRAFDQVIKSLASAGVAP
jgi:hypothetical protein